MDSEATIQAAYDIVRLSQDVITPARPLRRKPAALRDAAVRFIAERSNCIDVRRDAAEHFDVDRRTIARWCDAAGLERTYIPRSEKRRTVLDFINDLADRKSAQAEAARKFHVSQNVVKLWCRLAARKAKIGP